MARVALVLSLISGVVGGVAGAHTKGGVAGAHAKPIARVNQATALNSY